MSVSLTVRQPFSTYNRGDVITNSGTIANILASENKEYCIITGAGALPGAQHTGVQTYVTSFPTLSDIPAGFVGNASAGNNLYICDGTSIKNISEIPASTTVSTTVFDQARPVVNSIIYNITPSSPVAQTTDYHGMDIHYYGFGGNFNGPGATPSAIYAFESTVQYAGAGNINALHAVMAQAEMSGSGVVSKGIGIRLYNQNISTGSITNSYGIYGNDFGNSGGGAVPTNHFGIYFDSLITAANNYAIYTNLGKIRFGDSVSITNVSATPGILIAQSGAANGLQITQAGASAALNVSSGAGASGLYNTVLLGYDYGTQIRTLQNSGNTLLVQKDGTGAGAALTVINKGTGNSIAINNGTTNTLIVDSAGMINELSKEVVVTDALTTKTITKRNTYLTGTAGASMAVTLPAAAAAIDGQKVQIMSVNTRTSTTWISTGATGGFVGAPATLTALTPVKLQYDHASLAWYISL